MEAVLASMIAVAGTLLGSTVTYVFQHLGARRAERIARQERLWRERMTVYSEFAGAATELLRANISLWFLLQRRDQFDEKSRRDAYTEADRRGAAANHARFRVQMIASDPSLVARADATFGPMDALRDAADRDELAGHEQRCRSLIEDFVTAARAEVRGPKPLPIATD